MKPHIRGPLRGGCFGVSGSTLFGANVLSLNGMTFSKLVPAVSESGVMLIVFLVQTYETCLLLFQCTMSVRSQGSHNVALPPRRREQGDCQQQKTIRGHLDPS